MAHRALPTNCATAASPAVRTVWRPGRALALRAKGKRKYKATTQSDHNLPVAPNLLEQHFEAQAPNQKWVSDITYVWTEEGWLYLAVVLDLFSRRVVGYAMSKRIDRALVMVALRMALFRRKFPRGVIVHSDRGSQYCSADYQALLNEHGLICSMSKRGDCYERAACPWGTTRLWKAGTIVIRSKQSTANALPRAGMPKKPQRNT